MLHQQLIQSCILLKKSLPTFYCKCALLNALNAVSSRLLPLEDGWQLNS